MGENKMVQHTENWVKQLIVKYNICPFARKEVERGSICYHLVEAHKSKEILTQLIEQCRFLAENVEVETTLFIIPNGVKQFEDFLDLLDRANDLLYEQGFEGVYQLASFHPDYYFAGESYDDPANYTNRSPYPTLHIIRESSMQYALENHPDPDAIPARNIHFARKKGQPFFVNLLANCMK
ncbi:MAG: DUF1415 domain-containing protein [Candidatus Endonucleobacter sp. (ex Gigantidas childressi)]|nr:DUF1415 domain-containing protein [Candidatus Endonucleobacter sp. (ex Gigantidas childressi)]